MELYTTMLYNLHTKNEEMGRSHMKRKGRKRGAMNKTNGDVSTTTQMENGLKIEMIICRGE